MNTNTATFADVRRCILDTIDALKKGEMDTARGMAIAANFKVLNDNIQTEINATKLALATEDRAHSFGRVVRMGRLQITGNSGDAPPWPRDAEETIR